MIRWTSYESRYERAQRQQERWRRNPKRIALSPSEGGGAVVIVAGAKDHDVDLTRRQQQERLIRLGTNIHSKLAPAYNHNTRLVSGSSMAGKELKRSLGDRAVAHITLITINGRVDDNGPSLTAVDIAEKASHLKHSFEHFDLGMRSEHLSMPLGELILVDALGSYLMSKLDILDLPAGPIETPVELSV